MPDHLGDDMRKEKKKDTPTEEKEVKGWLVWCRLMFCVQIRNPNLALFTALDETDITVIKRYVSFY
jgi:hypothetical protein